MQLGGSRHLGGNAPNSYGEILYYFETVLLEAAPSAGLTGGNVRDQFNGSVLYLPCATASARLWTRSVVQRTSRMTRFTADSEFPRLSRSARTPRPRYGIALQACLPTLRQGVPAIDVRFLDRIAPISHSHGVTCISVRICRPGLFPPTVVIRVETEFKSAAVDWSARRSPRQRFVHWNGVCGPCGAQGLASPSVLGLSDLRSLSGAEITVEAGVGKQEWGMVEHRYGTVKYWGKFGAELCERGRQWAGGRACLPRIRCWRSKSCSVGPWSS